MLVLYRIEQITAAMPNCGGYANASQSISLCPMLSVSWVRLRTSVAIKQKNEFVVIVTV